MRRRSNGKMTTLVSVNKPNQIIGEDCDHEVEYYHASYMADGIMHEDDDRLGVAFSFDLYCSGEVDDLQRSIQFSTQSENGETADLRFTICDQDNDEDEESLILQAMSSWKWD
ncbi:hypothetical protein ACHAWO_004866 [Cyclotella atomus]|uniref:Uncharacterized protein n=1 Tax=Cyclotella atomus TaxID=382360 RepID=A0ABD3NFX0_9STRA